MRSHHHDHLTNDTNELNDTNGATMPTHLPFARRALLAVAAAASLTLAACGEDSIKGAEHEKTKIEETATKGVKKVTLSEVGAERIQLQTEAAKEGDGMTTVPYAAVLYDPEGATWVFSGDAATRAFQRVPVTVDHITGDVAFLADGLKAGDTIVVQGAAQLRGAELGMGH